MKDQASKKLCFVKYCLGISITITALHLLCLLLCSPYFLIKVDHMHQRVIPTAQTHLQDQALPQNKAQRSGFPIPNTWRS